MQCFCNVQLTVSNLIHSQVKEEKPEELPPTSLLPLVSIDPTQEKAGMEIDVVGDNAEIDPDDDMAGIMREMNDAVNKTSTFNESIASETSTDTAFSLSTQMNDKDDLVTM